MTDAMTWKALSDPTRRAILDLLREQPRTTGDICSHFPNMTRIAAMKHLRILEAANLVFVRHEGRLRWNHLNPVPIQQIYERWMKPFEPLWGSHGLRLKEFIEAKKGKRHERTTTSSRRRTRDSHQGA
jgi:DNA-binding transcriptional ArsR family regulator